jgi:pyruvate kinase
MLERLCLAGMNVARLNFSHGTHEEHKERILAIKRVRERLGLPIAILLDTKGPEYRIKTFKNGKITLSEGDRFVFTSDEVEGDEGRVSVSYKSLPKELREGDTILLDNGLMSFRVERIIGSDIECTVTVGGVLSDRKSMSFPGKVLKQPYLSEQDEKDLLFGIENGVDFIACSFVSSRQDLLDVKGFIRSNGGKEIGLIAKIENGSGVENIREILSECEGIMIGRGDLGVEMPFEEIPAIQKKLIMEARMLGKVVITATEMLESMITNARPTRAEISDVANAVYDGTSALMLSGETAVGKYPDLAVSTMSRIAEYTEGDINYEKRFASTEFHIKDTTDAISHATCGMAIDLRAKAIVVCTVSGMTARMVSRFRPPINIVAVTTGEKTWRKLALSWGVIPVLSEEFKSTEVMFYFAVKAAEEKLGLSPSDKVIITGGTTNGVIGGTNLVKVETI